MSSEKKKMTLAEKWESLTFANNFIFCKVLEDNPDITKEILELLLDIQIDHIEQPASQKEFKVDFDSRGIRFDVYVKDGGGRSFDIEIQTSHFLNLGKRDRYYQGLPVYTFRYRADENNLRASLKNHFQCFFRETFEF